jgi:thymidylate kinase
MIIELFGAPTVGKTTFAHALATRLQERGHRVELIVSFRPAETMQATIGARRRRSSNARAMAVVNRMTRPAVELVKSAGQYMAGSRGPGIAGELLTLLPARSVVWSFRLSQYITRLDHSWRRAGERSSVVIFDQGFVQAVCSLVLLGRSPDPELVSRALASIPNADLLIKLDAPRDLLVERLEQRSRGQGRLERLLELDVPTNLRSIGIVDTLHLLLERQGHNVAGANCVDHASMAASLAGILSRIETVTPGQAPWAHAC